MNQDTTLPLTQTSSRHRTLTRRLSPSCRAILWRHRFLAYAVSIMVILGLSAISLADPPTGRTVVALTTDLQSGQPLQKQHVTLINDSTPGAVDEITTIDDVLDLPLRLNLTSGTVLTRSMLSVPPFGDVPPEHVIMPVTLAEEFMATFALPGMHVDLLGVLPINETTDQFNDLPSQTIASRALVLPEPPPTITSSTTDLHLDIPHVSSTSSTILIALTPDDALKVATATRWGPIHAVIVE